MIYGDMWGMLKHEAGKIMQITTMFFVHHIILLPFLFELYFRFSRKSNNHYNHSTIKQVVVGMSTNNNEMEIYNTFSVLFRIVKRNKHFSYLRVILHHQNWFISVKVWDKIIRKVACICKFPFVLKSIVTNTKNFEA